jgi:hypothetical protein
MLFVVQIVTQLQYSPQVTGMDAVATKCLGTNPLSFPQVGKRGRPVVLQIITSLQPDLRKQDVHSQVISGLLTILRDKQLCESGNI